jgi:DnaJ-class molecular chaperone
MICPKCGQEMGDTTAHSCALVTTYPPMPERRPWKCPVCNGTGKAVQCDVMTPITVPVPCPACNGACIVWGP